MTALEHHNRFSYLNDKWSFFSVDGLTMRSYALVLPERLAAAQSVYDAASALSRVAAQKTVQYLSHVGRPPPPGAEAAAQRNLELFIHLVAAEIAGENFDAVDNHYLRYVVAEARHGLEARDGSAMSLVFTIAAARDYLTGSARELFEQCAWRALEVVRNGGAGAAMGRQAHALATRIYDRLDESVIGVAKTYGPPTRQKAIRDIAMVLQLAQNVMTTADRAQAKANLVAVLFDEIAPHVGKYNHNTWMPLFRHYWEAIVSELPEPANAIGGEAFAQLSFADRRFTSALRLYDSARTIAREVGYAMVGGDEHSGDDVSLAAAYAHVVEPVLKRVAAHLALGTPALQTGLSRHWLHSVASKLPAPTPSELSRLAITLHDVAKRRFSAGWGDQLERLFQDIRRSAERFEQAAAVTHAIPKMVFAIMRSANKSGQLQNPARTERHTFMFVNRCFELACRGDYDQVGGALWHWHWGYLFGVEHDNPELVANIYQVLPEAFQRCAPNAPRFLAEFFEAIGVAATHFPASRMMRDPSAAREISEAVIRDANIQSPANEYVFLLEWCADALLAGQSPAAIRQLMGRIGEHLMAHHNRPTRIDELMRALDSFQNLTAQRLPEVSRAAFAEVVAEVRSLLPHVAAGFALADTAERLAQATIQRFAETPGWQRHSLQGKEDKAARDLAHVLRVIGMHARALGPSFRDELEDWGTVHLIGFLRGPTYESVGEMLQQLEESVRTELGAGYVHPVMECARAVYQVKRAA